MLFVVVITPSPEDFRKSCLSFSSDARDGAFAPDEADASGGINQTEEH